MLGGPPHLRRPPPLFGRAPKEGQGVVGTVLASLPGSAKAGSRAGDELYDPAAGEEPGARSRSRSLKPAARPRAPQSVRFPPAPPAPASYSRMSPPSSRDPPFPAAVPVAGGSQNSSLILPAERGAASDTPGLSASAHHAQPGPHAPAGEPRACQHPKRHLLKLGPSGYARCICLCWLSTGSLGTGDPCAKRHWCVRCLQGRRRGKLHRGGSG